MSYEIVEEDYSGGGTEILNMYLYPNTATDDVTVESTGSVRAGAEAMGRQLVNNDIVYGYQIAISYEHPGSTPYNDATKALNDFWKPYDGPNDKDSVVGCHFLVYQISTEGSNGVAQSPVGSSSGAFDNSYDGVLALNPVANGKPALKNMTIHEIGHTVIADTTENQQLGDSDYSDDVDHELGQVYPGLLGDGPVSPMSSGYVDGEGREGNCSNSAPWNLTYDEKLSSCSKEAIKNTSEY